ncbi:uncharacterized protein FIBRA_09239 [Fibroporia radiculosa]|uniref:Uncharacterized protein n=1 Tax=Fibroporia radiculosa TaxID=599839 RepID=J7RH79_9APHY|nr:uncharacterized protein FIBRA_09239 [Fibroporia radiculosa]CCM06927.1 predicted protein [Fibroporia radiculosa]
MRLLTWTCAVTLWLLGATILQRLNPKEQQPLTLLTSKLEECFTAGIIEVPVPRHPILSFPSQQESDDSSLEFLEEGGFRYPFPPFLPNVTHWPFLIPGPPDSSNSDAVVLHQFPGPLDVPQNSEATPGSYHVAPARVFPSSSPMNISSSPNPDSPLAASTDSPTLITLLIYSY